ncbi:LysR family transcriptional regulator [Flammeovirgaceae bacterium SG7u.111]|nr:LysR family transcriptional regulator [Flammeovirgaceae bacterium SG7u.132]WPO33372.1 LysR family transcriptional regulator [Flammeovirgaceae bacterium SG7u.111]
MNYTLHQLTIFLKVAEKQSITRAADELHLTQPAVSIQLKNLQDQFDIPLFEVIGRQLYITDFGKEIVASSQKIISEVNEIKNKSLAYKGLLAGQLKISVVSTGKYVMPYFLSDFTKLHAGVQLTMDVTNKSMVIESLEKNEVDFALVSVLPAHMSVKRIELMENKLFMTRKFEEGSSKSIRLKTLEKTPLIFREWGSATRQAMETFISKSGIAHQKSIELTSNEAVKQAVIAGLGYSVMPLIGIKNQLMNKELEIIPVKGLPIITH